MKRFCDIFFSFLGLIVLLPLFIIIALFILVDSKGGVIFRQKRVGKGEQAFMLWKFRTMKTDAEKSGQLTVGNSDKRITRAGYYLRKYKLDELPQLINVLMGEMSLVGPRPEVKKYVELYTREQKKVLTVKPGITDFASIEYSRENELLASASDPEEFYVKEVMPAKLALNMKYIREAGFFTDMKILWQTVLKVMIN